MNFLDPCRRRLRRFIGLLALSALPLAALAQGFPSKPVTIIVPFVAGSPTDVIARAFATDFGTALNTPVVVDNRAGANQTIAGSYVARSTPDGYTLLFANLPAVIPPSLQSKLSYAGINDFAPVSDILTLGFVLVTSPDVKAKTLQEFVAMLKADPSRYSYGSSGISTPIHLMAEMFNKEIGVKTLHVPYKGGNQVQLDLMSDRVTYAFLPTGTIDYVRSGKLKSFGIASESRDPAYPEVPTMKESGFDFKTAVKFVLVAPKATPPDVVAKLNAAANKVLASEAFYNRVKPIGGIELSKPATPSQVGAHIASEEGMWDDLVKKANIQLE